MSIQLPLKPLGSTPGYKSEGPVLMSLSDCWGDGFESNETATPATPRWINLEAELHVEQPR